MKLVSRVVCVLQTMCYSKLSKAFVLLEPIKLSVIMLLLVSHYLSSSDSNGNTEPITLISLVS